MSTLNKSQLYASFPDNNIGQIAPFNMRDFVDSVELKYNNYTVVKPGQPLGNAFPDPVGGKITLPAGSVWLINGSVTVNYPIHLEDGAAILGLSRSINSDTLQLDDSAGAVALINSGANGTGDQFLGNISSVTLNSGAGSGRIFNIVNPLIFLVDNCNFFSLNTGSVALDGGVGFLSFSNIYNYASDSPLQITGDGDRLVVSNFRSGVYNANEQINIIGSTFLSVLIDGCFNAAAPAMFALDEAATATGIVSNNAIAPGSSLASGVAADSINWTFFGNSGVPNTIPLGAIAFQSNSTPTVITASGTFYPVAGASIVAGSVIRFESPSDSALKYIGTSAFKGVATVSVSLNNPHLTLPYDYKISLFKNGVILEDGGVSYVASAIVDALSKQTLSFSAPISAALDDVFEVVLSSTIGTQSPIVEDLTFSIS